MQATKPKVKISQEDRIVVVMGPPGSGKSTFIEYATQQGGQTIDRELQSCTSGIRTVRCNHPHDGKPVIFVDTPGFDDTGKSDIDTVKLDIDIMSLIAGWFVHLYKEHVPISAIVYLHRISDNRMAGLPLKNLQMFVSMCGEDFMPRVVICTTMWNEVREESGKRREEELKSSFWKDMIDHGCQVQRFGDSERSAWKIIGKLPAQSNVLLSKEMVDDKKWLNETSAGVRLDAELQKLITDQREEIRQLEEQARKQGNTMLLDELKKRKAELEAKIGSVTSQFRQVKISFWIKIASLFQSRKSGI